MPVPRREGVGKDPPRQPAGRRAEQEEYDRAAIRNTWGRGHDNVVFVLGACCRVHPSQRIPWTCRKKGDAERSARYEREQAAVCAEQDQSIGTEAEKHGDIVFMAETDVYRHLPQKVKRFYSWGLENTEATWFLKADSDFYVRVDSLMVYLAKGELRQGPLFLVLLLTGGVFRDRENGPKKPTGKGNIPSFRLALRVILLTGGLRSLFLTTALLCLITRERTSLWGYGWTSRLIQRP